MKISDALSEVRLLYVETSPFIYYAENRPVYVDKMRSIFKYLHEGRVDVITSTITLSESLTKPLRQNDSGLVRAYSDLFETTRGLSLIPVDVVIARLSADLRARYGLKTPDALHLATAIETKSDAFLTNDKMLKRVTEGHVLVLDELEID